MSILFKAATADQISNRHKGKKPECSTCPYFDRTFVPSYRSTNKDIVIVGEAPGAQEAIQGTPFIGESGQLLRKTLGEVGFDVSTINFTNTCRCHPPNNEQPDKKAQKLCTKLFLFDELKEINPKLVVLSGATALNVFFPKENIMAQAGNFYEAQGMNFLPVLHPAYCLRNPSATPRLRKDLKKAYQYLYNEGTDKKKYIIALTPDILKEAHQALITDAPDLLTFDLETNEKLDVFDKEMLLWTAAFGLEDGRNYCLPLDHPENTNLEFREECWKLFKAVLVTKAKKVSHNAGFDFKLLKKFEIPYCVFYADTMVMAFLLDENRFSLKLRQLASEYLDGCMYPLRPEMMKLCLHNCEDTNNTMGIFKIFEAELRKFPGMWELFENILMPMIEVIAEMELNGVLIDEKASTDLAGTLNRKLEAIYEAIVDEYPITKDINFNSPKQLSELMFGVLKYPKIKKTDSGQQSTDSEVLEKLSKGGYKLATYLLKTRKYEKLLSTYVEKLPDIVKYDGRLHGNFNLVGTKTGRTSSSDPNLQNIPRDKLVKSMFIASPGCMLLQADASQAELRVACSIADEPTMIKAYRNDEDLHKLTASNIFGVPLDKISEEDRQKAKSCNFGFIYGASAEGYQYNAEKEYGLTLTLQECINFRKAFFKTYSGFNGWYDRSKDFVRKNGYIEYPTGRRARFPEVKGWSSIPDDVFRKAVNYPVQGSSSDILLFMMVRMARVIKKYKMSVKMILTVHDSIVFDGPKDDLMTISYEMNATCIEDIPKRFSWMQVPMKFDYCLGYNWGKLDKIKI